MKRLLGGVKVWVYDDNGDNPHPEEIIYLPMTDTERVLLWKTFGQDAWEKLFCVDVASSCDNKERFLLVRARDITQMEHDVFGDDYVRVDRFDKDGLIEINNWKIDKKYDGCRWKFITDDYSKKEGS